MNRCEDCRKLIPNEYYHGSSCRCCTIIKTIPELCCSICNQTKPSYEFERPKLIRCRDCVNIKARTKVNCQYCGKSKSYSNLSKHVNSVHIIGSTLFK